MTIKRRWNPPHAAFAQAQLGLLLRRVLVQSIRRVRDHCMNGVVLLPPDPIEAIRMVKNGPSNVDGLPPLLRGQRLPRYPSRRTSGLWFVHDLLR